MQVADIEEANVLDFDFFMTIAKHPKLNMKNAIQVLDFLGKMYLSSAGFGRAAGVPFVIICTRFIETPPLQEYLYRFCKYALKLVVDFEKQRKAQAQKKVPKYLSNALSIAGLNEELPEEAITGQRRIMTYDMVSRVIGMKNMNLNIRLKEVLVEDNFTLKKETGRYSKGMTVVLGLLGNAEEILAKAEEEEQKLTFANSSDLSEPLSAGGKPRISLIRSYIGLAPAKPAKASSRMPKRRVLKAIEKAKKKRADKEMQQALLADQEKRHHEKQKRILKKQFEQMKIATEKNAEQPLILAEMATNLPQMELIYSDLSQEPPEDQEGVNLILRKYTRVLRLLYDRYAGSGYRKGNHPHELIGEHQKMISEAEMYRLVKEQGVSLSKDIHLSLFRAYCLKTKRADNMNVDYEGYLGLVIQEALYVFSRPPKDLSLYPPYVAVNALFDLFRSTSANTDNPVLPLKYYDEPDPGAGDREMVKRLNQLLEKDRTAQLPEGYRKVTDKDLEVRWELPVSVVIPESGKLALSVLDDILVKVCGIHILEPLYTFVPVVRARGILAVPTLLQSPLRLTPSNSLSPLPSKPLIPTVHPGLKYQMAVLNPHYSQEHVSECAKLVEDLVYSVLMKSPVLLSKEKKNAAELTNKVKLQREMEEKEMVLKREKAEQRRKLRQQVVKETLKKHTDAQQSVSKAEQEQGKLSQQEKLARLQKRSEDREKQREEKRKMIENWRKQQSSLLDPESEAKNKTENEGKRKQQEEFLARERKRIRDLLKAKELQRVEMMQKAEEEEKRKLEQRKNSKQRLVHKLESDLKRHEEEKAKRERINGLATEPEFASVYSEYEKSIEVLFRHYSGLTTKPDQNPVLASTALQYIGFNKFVTQMEICPNLVSAEYGLHIFRQLTKDKRTPEMPVIALNLEEFKTALVRLAVGGKETLRQMTGKLPTSADNTIEIEDFKDFLAYLMLTPDPKKTAKTLQGLTTMISKKRDEGSIRPSSKTASERGMKKKSKSTSRLLVAES